MRPSRGGEHPIMDSVQRSKWRLSTQDHSWLQQTGSSSECCNRRYRHSSFGGGMLDLHKIRAKSSKAD